MSLEQPTYDEIRDYLAECPDRVAAVAALLCDPRFHIRNFGACCLRQLSNGARIRVDLLLRERRGEGDGR